MMLATYGSRRELLRWTGERPTHFSGEKTALTWLINC
jgi:hypothetical protein